MVNMNELEINKRSSKLKVWSLNAQLFILPPLKIDLLNLKCNFEMIICPRKNRHNTQLHSQARSKARRAWQLPNISGNVNK